MKPSCKFIFAATAALIACKKVEKTPVVTTSTDYQKGEALLYVKNDSAFYYFNKVTEEVQDSLQVAMAYNNMAVIQIDGGDYFGSQESLMESMKYLDEKRKRDYSCLASNYNELGTSNLNLKNYNEAIYYYDMAIQFSTDSNYRSIFLNNKAVAHQKKGDYTKAIEIYRAIKDKSRHDKIAFARVTSNLARTLWLQDPNYAAGDELLMALAIRQSENNDWGLNASYAHLSDYYAGSKPDSSLYYAHMMYKMASWLNSPDDQLEALQKLIKLSSPVQSKQFFLKYLQLNDSLQYARNSAKNQFALIRYEAEKNRIYNLELQKENAEKKIRIIQQQVLFYLVLAAIIISIVGAVSWYKKRKTRMEWEAKNAVRENQLKLSQRVHDVVANGLYRLMSTLEHSDAINRKKLLDEIEVLYERSRDISYENPGDPNLNFAQTVMSVLNSFSSDKTKVSIVGNNEATWSNTSLQTRNELQLVLQELMTNMKKHSRAHNVLVRFEKQAKELRLLYRDDGIGLSTAFKYGNGLSNTENRIKTIGGRIRFDRSESKGVTIELFVPQTS